MLHVKKKSIFKDTKIDQSRLLHQNISLPEIRTNLKVQNIKCDSFNKKSRSANECLKLANYKQPKSLLVENYSDYIKNILNRDQLNNKKSSKKININTRLPLDTNDLEKIKQASQKFDTGSFSQRENQVLKINDKVEKSNTIENKFYQSNSSPYFWYYREKTNFSPLKSYNTPRLESFKVSEPITEISFSQESLCKSLNDSKTNRKMEISENYKNYGKNKIKQKKLKQKQKQKKQNRDNKTELPKIRIKLTSAKLRKLAVSEKLFMLTNSLAYHINHSVVTQNKM